MERARLLELEERIRERRQAMRRGVLAVGTVWVVTCPNNDRAVSEVLSPIKPRHCPMCGDYTTTVIEKGS